MIRLVLNIVKTLRPVPSVRQLRTSRPVLRAKRLRVPRLFLNVPRAPRPVLRARRLKNNRLRDPRKLVLLPDLKEILSR
jgi:hypothetical protein